MLVLFFVAWAAAPARPELLRLEQSVEAMGSTYSVAVYGEDRERLETAVTAAFDEARRLDDLLSNYKPDSAWSRMNREAAEHPVKVPREMFELLRACQEYSRRSEGAFDISVGPLMKLWGFYRGSGRLPHKGEILAALRSVGYEHVKLDAAALTVRFDRPGVELDPGGIGKGYAVDRMVQILKEKGVTAALVSAAGSSIYALGAPPNEPRGWRITIRDPKDDRKTAAEVFLQNESMSTSGNYEKFFRAEGKVYAHIMDPRTGYPAEGMLSVSVMAPRTMDSEAWTKPVFINGHLWAEQHKPKGFRAFICETANRGAIRGGYRSATSNQVPAGGDPGGSSSTDRTNQPCAWLP